MQNMILFIIRRQPVTISLTVFSNLTKVTNYLFILKECLTTVKQVFIHYQEGSLVDHQAYKPYTLVGPQALRLVLDPIAVILLDNRLYI